MCREEILEFCKVIQKGLFWKLGLRFGDAYMCIYCRWVKVVFALRIPIAFFAAPTPHRWTAIGVGASRNQTATVSLSTARVPISNAIDPIPTQRTSFRSSTHTFVVCAGIIFVPRYPHTPLHPHRSVSTVG